MGQIITHICDVCCKSLEQPPAARLRLDFRNRGNSGGGAGTSIEVCEECRMHVIKHQHLCYELLVEFLKRSREQVK